MGKLSVLARLQRGDVLHMQLGMGGRSYWFEHPYQPVSEGKYRAVEAELCLIGAGDSLFGDPRFSQSILAVKGGVQ